MALITSIPLGSEKQDFLKHLLHTQSQKELKKKNSATEQCNFPQGCIVTPIKKCGT
jgi:hypothetical protein